SLQARPEMNQHHEERDQLKHHVEQWRQVRADHSLRLAPIAAHDLGPSYSYWSDGGSAEAERVAGMGTAAARGWGARTPGENCSRSDSAAIDTSSESRAIRLR